MAKTRRITRDPVAVDGRFGQATRVVGFWQILPLKTSRANDHKVPEPAIETC